MNVSGLLCGMAHDINTSGRTNWTDQSQRRNDQWRNEEDGNEGWCLEGQKEERSFIHPSHIPRQQWQIGTANVPKNNRRQKSGRKLRCKVVIKGRVILPFRRRIIWKNRITNVGLRNLNCECCGSPRETYQNCLAQRVRLRLSRISLA